MVEITRKIYHSSTKLKIKPPLSPQDFLAYFAYLIAGLAFGCNALAVASGGNADFITTPGAIAGILRLTFGYYDYDSFIANYQGLGRVGITTDVWYVFTERTWLEWFDVHVRRIQGGVRRIVILILCVTLLLGITIQVLADDDNVGCHRSKHYSGNHREK